ncbi:hypothetical protein ACNQGP_11085 [Flavobacterium sp. GT2N3]
MLPAFHQRSFGIVSLILYLI